MINITIFHLQKELKTKTKKKPETHKQKILNCLRVKETRNEVQIKAAFLLNAFN
jgi:hypothetical protein